LAFTCQQCGECCSSMGEIIEILEDLGTGSFRIGFTVTGEERIVSIDPEKQELFHKQKIQTLRPMACPFLRESGTNKFVCSVHTSRPGLCRRYSCYRILVMDLQGQRVGKVADASRNLTTTNDNLRKLWNREIADVAIMGEDDWEIHVEHTLTRRGYRLVH